MSSQSNNAAVAAGKFLLHNTSSSALLPKNRHQFLRQGFTHPLTLNQVLPSLLQLRLLQLRLLVQLFQFNAFVTQLWVAPIPWPRFTLWAIGSYTPLERRLLRNNSKWFTYWRRLMIKASEGWGPGAAKQNFAQGIGEAHGVRRWWGVGTGVFWASGCKVWWHTWLGYLVACGGLHRNRNAIKSLQHIFYYRHSSSYCRRYIN